MVCKPLKNDDEKPQDDIRSALLPGKSKKLIVAGAGITGLYCAYELMKSSHDVIVLEANGRHGGNVFTGRDGLCSLIKVEKFT